MTQRKWITPLVLVLVAGFTGYRFGRSELPPSAHQAGVAQGANADSASHAPAEKKILYYRNPMGLPDTSPTPKKDSMGMDYIAVYEGEGGAAADEPGTVSISPAKVQKLGVRTAVVERQALAQSVRGVGRVEVDERRLYTVAPRFEGWIERLHVSSTGQSVARGQALFDVHSPDLISAQREYQVAAQGLARLKDAPADAREGMQQVADSALARLQHWELSKRQIADVASGALIDSLAFASPASGVVLEKKAIQGMRFMPGETLYQIADISQVWVIVDIFERDLSAIKAGQPASVTLNAFPGRRFAGKVDFIYPTLNAATRTVPVRIVLANADGALRPAMYANVELQVGAGTADAVKPLVVPASAVLDGGARQSVLLVRGEGRFAPRTVKLGRRGDELVEVLEGLAEGDTVVTSANFLIDSESQLKAAFSSLGEPPQKAATASAVATHHGVGKIDAINTADGSVSVSHEAIASLKWPAMTMEFVLADPALVARLKPGAPVEFEFAEGKPGEWVISRITERSH